MKAVIIILFDALIWTSVCAQVKLNQPKIGTKKINTRLPKDTSSLRPNEFDSFSYEAYLQRQDSIKRASIANGFRQKLISIDSLIATQNSYRFRDTWFDFKITYRDGSIDTFIVNLVNSNKFRESDNFEHFVSELNLVHIQYALSYARYANQGISTQLPMQIDYINRQIDAVRYNAGANTTAYASGLLALIHKLLTENKSKLGIASITMYEDSFEPASLPIDGKITMREKFIRYVCTKINS